MDLVTIISVLYLIGMHWVADFLGQTDKMATNKSKSIKYLLLHTFVYSLIITVGIIFFHGRVLIPVYEYSLLYFFLIIFVTHTVIDFITSRITSKLYEKGKIRSFFDVIGLDQLSHYIILLLTTYYLYT